MIGENTIGNSPKVLRAKFWEVMCFFVLLAYASLATSRTLLQQLFAALSELLFRFKRFTLLIQTKKVISMNYGISTSSRKHLRWVRIDLILTLRHIYINPNVNLLTKFTSSRRSTEFTDILPRNISQMKTKTSFSRRIVICDKTEHSVVNLMETQWKLRQQHDQNFPMQGKFLAPEETSKPKRAELLELQSAIRVGKLTIWVRSLKIENYNRVHQVYHIYQNRLVSPYDGCQSLQRQTQQMGWSRQPHLCNMK